MQSQTDIMKNWTNEDIIKALRDIDRSSKVDVTEYEANFFETILSKRAPYYMTEKQKAFAAKMIEKYYHLIF